MRRCGFISSLLILDKLRIRVDAVQSFRTTAEVEYEQMEAARQVLKDIGGVPEKAKAHYFREEYLKGKSVAQIARELVVARSWCSRAYRKEAFKLAGAQFVKLVSMENS